MTDRCSTQLVTHRRENGTDWIRSRKTNAFQSLRVRRQIDLSALQASATSNPKALLVRGSLQNLFHLSQNQWLRLRKIRVTVQGSEQYPGFKGESRPLQNSAAARIHSSSCSVVRKELGEAPERSGGKNEILQVIFPKAYNKQYCTQIISIPVKFYVQLYINLQSEASLCFWRESFSKDNFETFKKKKLKNNNNKRITATSEFLWPVKCFSNQRKVI